MKKDNMNSKKIKVESEELDAIVKMLQLDKGELKEQVAEEVEVEEDLQEMKNQLKRKKKPQSLQLNKLDKNICNL
jgi:hypothetical protein